MGIPRHEEDHEVTTYEKGNLYQISIIDFKPDPEQPRKVIETDALAELAASIKKHGNQRNEYLPFCSSPFTIYHSPCL